MSRLTTFTSLRRGRLFLSPITAPQVLLHYLGVAATCVIPVPQSQLLLEPAQALLLLVQVLLVKELALAVDHKRMLLLLLLFQHGRRCELRMMWGDCSMLLLLLHLLLLAVGKAQVNWRAKKPGIEFNSRSCDGPGRDRAVPNPVGEVAAAAGCGGGALTGEPRLQWRQTTVVEVVSPAPSQVYFSTSLFPCAPPHHSGWRSRVSYKILIP